MKRISCFSTIVLTLLLQSRCTPEAGQGEIKRQMSLAFTGDIIMHIPVKTCARLHDSIDPATGESLNNGGYDFLFERISPLLSSADITVGNMEFPCAAPYSSRPWIFNCPPQVIPAMKKAGIRAVSVANNHVLDQKQAGLLETMELLKKNGIPYIGAGATETEARAGQVFQINGIRAGLLAYTGVSNFPLPKKNRQVFVNWFYDEDTVLQDISSMKTKSDIIILIVHTGVEYMPTPTPKDRSLMKKYADSGADVIIGHHPHIVQPAEKYTASDGRETVIFYSIGNFISNQSSEKIKFPQVKAYLSTRIGLVVKMDLKKLTEKNGVFLVCDFDIVPVRTVNLPDAKTGRRLIQTDVFGAEEAPDVWLLSETGDKTGQAVAVTKLEEKLSVKKALPEAKEQ